jgi:hypothetical protein
MWKIPSWGTAIATAVILAANEIGKNSNGSLQIPTTSLKSVVLFFGAFLLMSLTMLHHRLRAYEAASVPKKPLPIPPFNQKPHAERYMQLALCLITTGLFWLAIAQLKPSIGKFPWAFAFMGLGMASWLTLLFMHSHVVEEINKQRGFENYSPNNLLDRIKRIIRFKVHRSKHMKKVTNIEVFNGIAGRIFDLLYKNFPAYVEIDFNSLGIDLIDEDDPEAGEKAFNMLALSEETFHWLEAAKYIWLEDRKNPEDPYRAVLSPKGFEVLKAIPKAIDKKKTLGEKIGELSKGKINEAYNQVVGYAISLGFKLMINDIQK